MGELRVSVFRLGDDCDCFKVGEIIWDGKRVRVEPPGIRELEEIANSPTG
jgi:hypothetical protein